VTNLENQDNEEVWGASSAAPYLSKTLRAQGVLLSRYYGIDHNSHPNYLAQISGQGSNIMTRLDCPVLDCPVYAKFRQTGTSEPGHVKGTGCVYPASVPTLAGQLSSAGKSWKGYMEDMGAPCQHPDLGSIDDHQKAKVGDQYATRHNPFVYFEEITSSPDCQNNVVDYTQFADDLKSTVTTPNLSYITPNLCNDGHDTPCVDGRPGGLESADSWLQQQIPAILDSPAFRQDGLLVITFDESERNTSGPEGVPGGTAGGRVGALVISPLTKGGNAVGQDVQPLQPARQHRGHLFSTPTGIRRGTRPEQFRPGRLQRPVTARAAGARSSRCRSRAPGQQPFCSSSP
jgi:hypothetical protein